MWHAIHHPDKSESGTDTMMSVDHSHAFHEVWKTTSQNINSAVDTPAAVSDSITPDGGEKRAKDCSDTTIDTQNYEHIIK